MVPGNTKGEIVKFSGGGVQAEDSDVEKPVERQHKIRWRRGTQRAGS